jgi:hypothetical protein
MIGGLSFVVSLSMAEIAAALPTAGGIYYVGLRKKSISCFRLSHDFLLRLSPRQKHSLMERVLISSVT